VELAGNVPEALRLIRSFQPDIVFLDIVMPQQDGFDLLKGMPLCVPSKMTVSGVQQRQPSAIMLP
jgi:YesN/AraC family two-component response regulator